MLFSPVPPHVDLCATTDHHPSSYPGAHRHSAVISTTEPWDSPIALFAGEAYQIPMSETVLFGGVALGAIACLSYFRNCRGQTYMKQHSVP